MIVDSLRALSPSRETQYLLVYTPYYTYIGNVFYERHALVSIYERYLLT